MKQFKSFSFTGEKIWDIIEGLIDERLFTNLESYKEDKERQLEINDIVDSIEDLAWEIQNDMEDSL